MFLKEDGGHRAFFPDSNGRSFRFTSDVGVTALSFVVEGTSSTPEPSENVVIATPTPLPGHSSGCFRPYQAQRPIFSSRKASNLADSFTLKIIQASVVHGQNNKISFVNHGQMFTTVVESTATVPYLSSMIQEKWGKGYVLVTSDGLRLEDSDGTRGMYKPIHSIKVLISAYSMHTGLKFWNVPSQKIYAVQAIELQLPSKGKGPLRRKSLAGSSEESENDFEVTPAQKKMKDVSGTTVVIEEIRQLKSEVQSVLKITKNLKYPPGLYLIINNAFSCKICLGIINPPVIFARCCKNILGCETCVDNLYGGENGTVKRCPLCRSERAFSETCRINGLDDFLKGLKPLFGESHATSHDDSDDDFNFP